MNQRVTRKNSKNQTFYKLSGSRKNERASPFTGFYQSMPVGHSPKDNSLSDTPQSSTYINKTSRKLSLGNMNMASTSQGSSNVGDAPFQEMLDSGASTPNTVKQNPRAASGIRPEPPQQNEHAAPNIVAQLGVVDNAHQDNAPSQNANQNTTQSSAQANASIAARNGEQMQNTNQPSIRFEHEPSERQQSAQSTQRQNRSQQHMYYRTPHIQSSTNERPQGGHNGQRSQSHQQSRSHNTRQFGGRHTHHEARSERSNRESQHRSRLVNGYREVGHSEALHNPHNQPPFEPFYDNGHREGAYHDIVNNSHSSQPPVTNMQDRHEISQMHVPSPALSQQGYANTSMHQGADYGQYTNFQANGRNEQTGAMGPMLAPQAAIQQHPSYNPPPKLFLKPIEPQPFSGDKHAMSAIEFLDELDRYQEATGYTEREMVNYVIPHFLKGEAQQWWVSSQMFSKFTSYNEFCTEFRNQYQPYNYIDQLRIEFDRRTQGEHERLSDYIVKILQYYRRLDMNYTETEVVYKVIRGLNPEYTPYFRTSQNYANFREFQREAHAVDAQVARARQYVPPGRQSIEPNLLPTESSYALPRPQYSTNRSWSNERNNNWSSFNRSRSPYNQYNDRRVSFNMPDQPRTDYRYQSPERPSNQYNLEKAESYQRGRNDSRNGRFENNDRRNGTYNNYVPSKANDSQTSQTGTREQNRDRSRSPSTDRQRSTSREKMSCFRCGGEHMIRDCTQAPSGNGRSPSQKRQ